MPGKVKVKIISGRNLPVMDRSSDTTDAYVEIKLGSTTYKTDVCRKSLHPQWNSDWYRFEVDDSELQDEPLQIRLMDHDTYSANDAIGKVYLDLNPLLLPAASSLHKWNEGANAHEGPTNSVMTGWIPVYDTMHGIRGEVNIVVKVELFTDFNKFRQSSCGVQFFCSPTIPHGYFAQVVHGFVEELVVNDDPEYQWIDKIRTPRASNEARQTLFFKLSGELQRKIGLKALDLGGNAVIGYSQSFDLEGESGIVARGIGTAVTLMKLADVPNQNNIENNPNEERAKNYLKFLGSAKGFFLNTSSNILFKKQTPASRPSPAPSVKSLKLDELMLRPDNTSKLMTRHLSDREFNTILRPLPNEIIHHSTSLQTLLKQEDMRGIPSSCGFSQKIRNLRYSSQNILSRKMFGFKPKAIEPYVPDKIDNADTVDAKKRHAFKYRRTQSDSTGMAEILVRSVFHAATSLDCIAESPNLKSQTSTEVENENEDVSLSQPDTSDTHSSKSSSSSSDSSSLEDEDTSENTTNVELDTVSHIVETVRKLSMIQQPVSDLKTNLIEIADDKLLYVVDDIEDKNEKILYVVDDDLEDKQDKLLYLVDEIETKNDVLYVVEGELEEKSGKLLYVVDDKSDDGCQTSDTIEPDDNLSLLEIIPLEFDFNKNKSFMKKSPTALSFSDNKTNDFSFENQFSSLHNIHDACSNVNKYSIHKGKETVLGHLFKRIDEPVVLQTAPPDCGKQFLFPENLLGMKKSSSFLSLAKIGDGNNLTSKFTSLHNIHDACAKINKHSAHKGRETVLGDVFQHVKKSPVKLEPLVIDDKHTLKDIIKEGTEKILHSPIVLLNKLDMKLHKKEEDSLLKTALGNVLTDTVNDILATAAVKETPFFPPNEPKIEIAERKIEKHKPPNLILKRHPSCPEPGALNLKTPSPGMKPKSADSSLIKDKLLKGPKAFFHRLDSKIHKRDEVKSDGLLQTALGNVLMDSVNEVLATSSTKSDAKMVNIKGYDSNSDSHKKVETPEKKVSRSNLLNASKKFFKKFHKKPAKINTSDSLLGTALGNVLMDSVQEMLATSSPTSPNPPKPNLVDPTPNLTVKTVNTEIDTGINTTHACLTPSLRTSDTPPNESRPELGHHRAESMGTRMSHSPAKLNSIPCILRRSSDSDLSITPKGNSLTGSDRSGGCSSGQYARAMFRSTVPQENFDIMEYPFLTMSKYPPGFIAFIGGSVSARSVKLLERITNIEEPESRDTWWSEIRMEIRSHARALHCNAVLGYVENTSICDDVCVLSASGTAAVIGYQYSGEVSDNIGGLPIIPKTNKEIMTTSLDRTDFEKEKLVKQDSIAPSTKTSIPGSSPERDRDNSIKQTCTICHLPYGGNAVPLRNSSSKCVLCRSGKVPDVLIATIEMPEGIPSVGRGCFVQSYVCRPLRDLKGESNAKEISDGLPFLEYELHRLLINKLKVKGMNAVFGLKVRISVGERMLIGIATGTAVFLSPLPQPPLPKLMSDRTTDEKKLAQLQKSLHDTVKKNKEIYQLKNIDSEIINSKILSDTDESEDEQASIDLSAGNKDCCVLEVDDPEDVDVLNSLMEPRPPDGFHVVNTELVPGLEELEIVKNLQMFTQIWRAKIQPPYSLDKHFHRLLQSVYFKLRRMIPCALCDLQFRVDSPEPDEIQLCVLGMALGLGDPQKNPKVKRKNILPKRNDEELIFNLEEDQIPEHGVVQTPPSTNYLHTQTLKHRQKSPIRNRLTTRQRHVPYRERHGVDITPLSYVPGGKIEKYLGNLNFFFIRETTSIREEGGLSGFIHSFVTEILAIVRAHVTALGGNAMVAYFITECVLNHNLHKNQGQCLINVGGDVVYVTYYSEDH